jgi:hypothetical protein
MKDFTFHLVAFSCMLIPLSSPMRLLGQQWFLLVGRDAPRAVATAKRPTTAAAAATACNNKAAAPATRRR